MASPDRYYDGFIDFPKGINSGLATIELPPNQLGFMVNGTVRGGFASPRPPILTRTITFDTPENQALFESALWQGASYYKPDNGFEGFVLQVGGNLWFLQLVGDVFQATNITIPGDPNSATFPFAWIWQSESWALINNGVANTIIYNFNSPPGTPSASRLDPVQEALGTTSADFAVPVVGATVSVTLQSSFLGQVNQHVLLSSNGASYIVTDVGAGSVDNAQLTPIFSDGTTSYPIGTPLVQISSFVARLAGGNSAGQALTLNVGNYGTGFVGVIFDTDPGPAWLCPNIHTIIMKDQNGIDRTLTIRNCYTVGQTTLTLPAGTFIYFPGNVTQQQIFAVGTVIRNVGGSTTTIGTLGEDFTVPTVGIPSNTIVLPQYNGPDISVFMGNSQFTLHAIPVTPTSTVTLQNVNDTPAQVQPAGTVLYSVPELPPGRMGAYGQGRNWVALTDGRSFIASDLVGSSSGTAQYNFRDAVFHATENLLLAGGGSFFVPGNIGNISAMSFSAILDNSLGQGPLNVFCPSSVFSCNAPVDRTQWQNLSTPILPEVLIGSGAASQWSVFQTNADIIFRAPDGTVRSLLLARLDFHQWGNTPISYEMLRVINSEDLSLMSYCSACNFDNRGLITCNPVQNTNGVTFSGVMVLNYDTISTLSQKSPSVWEGLWTGFDAFWIGSGIFNGINRCFAFYNNSGKIGIKEVLSYASPVQDDTNGPIQLQFETPVFFKNSKGKGYYDYCQLSDGELYFSDLEETVKVLVEYRPDFYQNWTTWRQFTIPFDATQGTPQYRSRVGLGTPSVNDKVPFTETPTRLGRWFQLRISISGGRPLIAGCKISANAAPQPEWAPVQPCD